MASNNTFARNTGTPITGTDQVGNIAYGVPSAGYDSTGLKWWAGPDEDLGYIIAKEDAAGQHNGADSQTAYLGFRRSTEKTEASFVQLANEFTGQTFTTGDGAKTWLNNNGYWTSWTASGTGGNSFSTGDYKLSTQYAPAPNHGDIIFPAHPITGGAPGFSTTNPNLVGTADSNYEYELYINMYDANGNDRSSILGQLIGNAGTLTLSQGSNSITYSFTNQAFKHTQLGPSSPYFYDTKYGTGGPGVGLSPLGSITVIAGVIANFNTTDPINIQIQTV